MAFAAACVATALSTVAAAADEPQQPRESTVPLSDVELAGARGGLQTPSGLEFDFGATLRTYVDGELVLESRLTLSEKGAQAQEVYSSEADSPVGTPGGLLSGLAGGGTRASHDFTSNKITSLVLNTANNRLIRQETDLTLVIPQLAQFQQQAADARTLARLDSAVGAALRDAAAR